ncbi:hypothetical protein [Nocardia terpenica]|uniref:Uncharacterized protein n=1 Tax=Nocardia terpenica TaxID=455432 RepID=A0A291RPN4_9NOCA|nr:hypothetical protein [Nocardia terpenica]ATL69307.1 hypothetical protein CRH09_27155 [Nocardia terpenica]
MVVEARTFLPAVLRLVARGGDTAALGDSISAHLAAARPMLTEWTDQHRIHPLEIEWVGADDLSINPRTGKLRSLIDERWREPCETARRSAAR